MCNLIKSICILFLVPVVIFSQAINSTTTGGSWNNSSTWIGGVVPNENSDVVINSPVVTGSVTCNNLTINSAGILEDEYVGGGTVYVKGNFINYGTVRIGVGKAGLNIYVQGSIQNYGTLINNTVRFAGTGTQQFTSTKKISCMNIEKYPDGTIQAMSDIEIDSITTVNLNNDILNMGNYKLTKLSRKDIDGSGNIIHGGTVYSNGILDISGKFSSDLDGNPTLSGTIPLIFTGNLIKQNITIAAGKTISDVSGGGCTITINGNLTNNGIIKNRHGGLFIHIKGNVINNGEYSAYLRFIGDDTQTISGTQKYSCVLIEKVPDGKINAASDIVIDSITTVNLSNDILNMGNYKLTKLSRKNIEDSENKILGGTVYSNGILDISGKFGSDLDGNPTLSGTIPLLFTGNLIKQNITIAAGKTISDANAGGSTITINGNLTNNGIIKNRHGGLFIHIKGNVINNGEYSAYLRFIGDDTQTISGTQKYSCVFIEKVPDGKINAASDIVIDSITTVNLGNDILNMGNYKLKKISRKDFVNSNNIFMFGKIFSNSEIDIAGRFASSLDGDFILTGKDTMLFVGYNIIYNNLRIAKDKVIQDEYGSERTFTVYGDIYNYGTIKNRYGGLGCYAYGNVFNFGKFEINRLYIRSNDNTLKIFGEFNSNIVLEKSGGSTANFVVDQLLKTNYLLTINKDVILTVLPNAELFNSRTIDNYGTLKNEGKVNNRYYIYGSGEVITHDFMKIKTWIYDRATSDSVIITVNSSLHPKMTSSIKRWWNLKGNKNLKAYSVELYYDDNILNGQDPNYLDAYITTDNGNTWKKISNPVNITRDLTNKKITVGNQNNPINLVGDIILSSGNVANLPSISCAISGRKQVRVGPPNRFTITYWNNNNYPTDKFFIQLNTNQGVYIDGILSKKIGTDSIKTIPIDSLVYDNKKDEVLLMVQPLGPKEVRSFDVIVKSALGPTFKTTEPITFTAALLWIGGAIVEEYISNTIVAGCYEVWRPVRNDETLTDATVKVVKNSLQDAVTVENGVKGIAKKGAEEILKKTAQVAIWPVNLAKDVFDCLGNTIKGIKDYVNGNFDKQEKELVKVTSWDPNAKEGPSGVGANGFMSSTAPMTYTIFFENKKEATALAYQIVILDTLDQNVFDVNSVVFGATSHPNVKPTITRTGNILKWDFVGIELPPNVNPPEGEGWVKFTVNLKPNLPTGTQIKNKAVITFDINKPLATNIAINTLDFDPPTAQITSITKTNNNELSINWTANDANGSGIKNATVFVAVGDGPFSVAATSNKSPINIPVQVNNSYKIYILASDLVGNTQATPTKIHDITVDIEKEQEEIPTSYSLSQNYPNPFNPSTTIKYSIPYVMVRSSNHNNADVIPSLSNHDNANVIPSLSRDEVHVTLKIYDILGREVATLVNEYQKPGNYNYQFSTSNYQLSSGVYFYQLKAGDFIQTRKMLLLK